MARRLIRRSARRSLVGAMAHRRGGTALLEFAIVLPFLLALLFGTIEFGIFFLRYQLIHDAVRDAARMGALYRESCDSTTLLGDVRSHVVGRLSTQSVSVASGDITVSGLCGNSDEVVSVEVDYEHSWIVLNAFLPALDSSIESQIGSIARNQTSGSGVGSGVSESANEETSSESSESTSEATEAANEAAEAEQVSENAEGVSEEQAREDWEDDPCGGGSHAGHSHCTGEEEEEEEEGD